MGYAIGFDIGGTNIKIAVVSDTGEFLARSTERTVDGCDDWVDRLKSIITGVCDRQGCSPAAVGIAAPGLVAADRRRIVWMQGRMEAVQDLDWTERLGLGSVVPVINDAHAALLGEAWLGAARGRHNVLMLTLGTGVGGAVMVDGRILRGHLGRAGHFGHISLDPDGPPDITGTPGSLEDAVGDCTVLRRTGGRFASSADLVDAALSGDPEARAAWDRAVLSLACGLVSLINAFDPEAVVLGGGIAGAGDALFAPLGAHLDRFEWRPTGRRVELLPARLGRWAGAVGAAHNALESAGLLDLFKETGIQQSPGFKE